MITKEIKTSVIKYTVYTCIGGWTNILTSIVGIKWLHRPLNSHTFGFTLTQLTVYLDYHAVTFASQQIPVAKVFRNIQEIADTIY